MNTHSYPNNPYKSNQIKQQMNVNSGITLTFGDQAESHIGTQIMGHMAAKGDGFHTSDLETIKEKMKTIGVECILHDLTGGKR
jgi:hypothetical protein